MVRGVDRSDLEVASHSLLLLSQNDSGEDSRKCKRRSHSPSPNQELRRAKHVRAKR
jgi:hypothetical protein